MPSGQSKLVRCSIVVYQLASTTPGRLLAAAARVALTSCSHGLAPKVFTRTSLRSGPASAKSLLLSVPATGPLVPNPTTTMPPPSPPPLTPPITTHPHLHT